MSNGNDKFNMFEDFEEAKVRKVLHDDSQDENDVDNEYNDDVEIVSVTMKTESRKKFAASVVSRSQEDYETFIESVHYETLTHPVSGVQYQVKVTVLKPEINPQELLRPAYAYSTNH
ncbi:hypothetical protein GAP32_063 [Cronobacter phage vB_CsaM_GAP32]|uniref:Uncharacterized protein n=1 Tax=Cronobacter phage vB_CsaM_GAP32 TaxID=1141136 RepID=K4F5N2_9CAUD|nr:hypothetical protein GAP32_063 [Cronobacter phage vB_CsaM_GAP32]AFC21511.1 hypothetical protein GAP32_063 [Cronobacter phage vB_CsaM_GAP32]